MSLLTLFLTAPAFMAMASTSAKQAADTDNIITIRLIIILIVVAVIIACEIVQNKERKARKERRDTLSPMMSHDRDWGDDDSDDTDFDFDFDFDD